MNKLPKLQNALPGFESINRYWDRQHETNSAKILPGEYYVTPHDEMITTVLGSCVSACIWDKVFGIGGMNHFMLPLSSGEGWAGAEDIASTANRYGNYAMENLINSILSHGGHRKNLRVKIFGGAQIINSATSIGERNVDFVRCYIEKEGIPLVAEDVGSIYPRKVVFFPKNGRARVKKLKHLHNDVVVTREQAYQKDLEQEPVQGDIELF